MKTKCWGFDPVLKALGDSLCQYATFVLTLFKGWIEFFGLTVACLFSVPQILKLFVGFFSSCFWEFQGKVSD
jgi:hypothetical protein